MKKKLTTLFSVACLSYASLSQGINAEEITMDLTNKEKVVALLNSIETGEKTPIGYINPKQYSQHNLAIADGLAGFGAVLNLLPKGSAKVNVVRAFEDGDYVFTHTDYDFFGPKVGFDLFRFENGLIVEHWDNLTEKAKSLNPSGRSQIDGAVQIIDHANTKANKMLVKDFVETILVKGEFDKLMSYFDGDNYLQHNVSIPDQVSGLGGALEGMAEQGIVMVYEKNHAILGEGNFVLSISEGSFAGKPTSFYDLFRVENGKIAEHWDVLETILPENQWKNENGKFGNLEAAN